MRTENLMHSRAWRKQPQATVSPLVGDGHEHENGHDHEQENDVLLAIVILFRYPSLVEVVDPPPCAVSGC